MKDANIVSGAHAPRNFGIALVAVGLGILVLGILYHLQFMTALRHTRDQMKADGLIHGESPYPTSLTLITALVLLAIGVAAIVSMIL